ncbi:RNA-directed DNA polymerase from mobile element jockey [Trichonephila clavipes]|uniref:RNA-directed DNA polymerase from mobile element jockey n=1 Tax=Trichonephila clavipes TaxID=2585209 RepID=A0A8X6RX81_TRICX|nr:RNA-directed DNA polymerase from mobile element jockey [Trichonephila clavipes]
MISTKPSQTLTIGSRKPFTRPAHSKPHIHHPITTIPKQLREKIKHKNRLRKEWQQTKYPSLKTQINKLQREIKAAIINFKNSTWDKILEQATPEDNSLYSLIKKKVKEAKPDAANRWFSRPSILLERLKAFCNENNIIPDFQHGFKENTSTLHQLLRVNNQVIHGFSRRMITGGVFLDVQKAFDRIWHQGLIYKLIKCNFPPYLIHIINSFLNNRAFRVKIDHFISQNGSLKSGCPQVSLLSPLLFNIYTTDFPTHPEASIHLFADDTAILVTEKTESQYDLASNPTSKSCKSG